MPKNHSGMSHTHAHPPDPNMLTVEAALERVLALTEQLNSESKSLIEADGHTLSESIFAPINLPGSDNSAMDGYCVKSENVKTATRNSGVLLKVLGQVQAGDLPSEVVKNHSAIRIMTGAPIPRGCDTVVPWELTDEQNRHTQAIDEIMIYHPAQVGDHVRPKGEDTRQGDLVLKKGASLNPPSIGILASLGFDHVEVIKRPTIGIIATGNEVQAPGEKQKEGHLFDSNSYGIATAVKRWGGVPKILGIAEDNLSSLESMIASALDTDLVITSAGVSAGAFDLVKNVLSSHGDIDFWSVKMRPSRPLAFGLLNSVDNRRVPHLGLPGNPVSALVALVQFGKPMIYKMLGREIPSPVTVDAILDEPIVNFDGRRVFARVVLRKERDGLHARLAGAQGSNILSSMVDGDGMAICHEDIEILDKGKIVTVQLFDWLEQKKLG